MNYVQSGMVLVGIRIRVSFIVHISATTSTYKVCEAKTYLLRHSIIQTQCPWLLTDDLCPAGSRKNQDKGGSNFYLPSMCNHIKYASSAKRQHVN